MAAVLGVLATLQFVAGASALPNLVPATAAQWIQLIVGAIDAGMAMYIGRVATMPRDDRDSI